MSTDWQCKKWRPLDENKDSIFIESTTPFGFAIRNIFQECLNKKLRFEHEPLPSNRGRAFISRCRFSDIEKAKDAYERWKEKKNKEADHEK